MTTLRDVFQLLSCGEFRHINLGNEGKGILPNDYEGLLTHVNLGLTALYKRFTISKGEVNIKLHEDQVIYKLDTAASEQLAYENWQKALVSNPQAPEPGWDNYFIKDRGWAFKGNINKILLLATEKGDKLPFNDAYDRLSTVALSQDTLRFPLLIVNKAPSLMPYYKTDIVKVQYSTRHIPIKAPKCDPGAFFEPADIDLGIPDMYLEALCYFVASRVMNPIGLGQEFYAGDNYAAKFEAECLRLETLGLQLSSDDSNYRFRDKGFV